MYRNYRNLALLLVLFLTSAESQAQVRTGRQLLDEMKKAAAKIRAASYVVEYSNIVSNDRKDSSVSSVITVQARKIGQQQPGASYFYVQRNSGGQQTEVSYCGSVLTQRRHFSSVDVEDTLRYKATKSGKLPLDPDTLSSAQGFIRDVLYGRAFQTGNAALSAVKLFDGQRNWILEWEETEPKTKETSVWQLQVDKASLVPVEAKMRSYRGQLTTRRKIVFRNMQLNENANEVSCL
ncbi:MAG: hypothetical protein EOO15_05550 [Chitinophagaceae bacterium]|nr:MAG: hypothetical protein EOO15_05550 [Chitinophagaceae bacterium]